MMKTHNALCVLLFVFALALASACAPAPTATPLPTATQTPTATATPLPTAIQTPTATVTLSPTATPERTFFVMPTPLAQDGGGIPVPTPDVAARKQMGVEANHALDLVAGIVPDSVKIIDQVNTPQYELIGTASISKDGTTTQKYFLVKPGGSILWLSEQDYALTWQFGLSGPVLQDPSGNEFGRILKDGTVSIDDYAVVAKGGLTFIDTSKPAGQQKQSIARGLAVKVRNLRIDETGRVVAAEIENGPGNWITLDKVNASQLVVSAQVRVHAQRVESTPIPGPNVLGLKPLPESALPKIQIVPDPGNKYVDQNNEIYGNETNAFSIFKSAYYDGNDLIVTVNFYNKQANQFYPDRKVRFVDGKGKALFYGITFLNGTDIESIYAGTVVVIIFKDKNQFNVFNSNSDQPAVADTGFLSFNQKIIEHSP